MKEKINMDETRTIIRKLVEEENKDVLEEKDRIIEEKTKKIEYKEKILKELELKEKELEEKELRIKKQIQLILNQNFDDKTKINIIKSLLSIEFPEWKNK